MEPRPQPQQNIHWDSPEFDRLIDRSFVAKNRTEQGQCIKDAYLFAKRTAPPGTITAGKTRSGPQRGKIPLYRAINIRGGKTFYRIHLEELRHILKKHDVLGYED